MDTTSRTAHGYALDFLGGIDNDWYLWDLGGLLAVGPETHPLRELRGLDQYRTLLTDTTTVEQLHTRSPDTTCTVELFEYDYSLFLHVPLANATHVVNPDTTAPVKIADNVSIDGEDGVVLKSERRQETTKEAISTATLKTRVAEHDWLPVARIGN